MSATQYETRLSHRRRTSATVALVAGLTLVGLLASPASATVRVSLLDDTVLDTDALLFASSAPYGRAINGVSFQEEPHLTFGGYQFVTWYHLGAADEDVYLARRDLAGGAWEIMDTGMNMTRTTSDAHNVVAMGISGDGAIHLSWDHHGNTLRYIVSTPGAATGAAWNAAIFSGERSSLNVGGASITSVTYPRFVTIPGSGNMYLAYRVGASGDGDVMLATYNATTRLWNTPHEIIDGRDGDLYYDPLGYSTTRNAYLNGIDVDATGRIQLTWTWRESAGGTNHDILYAYSDDGGATWQNNVGTNLGSLMKLTSSGIYIDDADAGNGILGQINRLNTVMNQQTQAVDLDGRVHAIMWHADDAHRDAVSSFDTTAAAYFHYFRDPDTGYWTRRDLPTDRAVGSRPDMAYDADGNLYASYVPPGSGGIYTNGNLVIAMATKAADYTDWQIVYTDTRTFIGEPFIDQQRLLEEGLLSIFIQENSDVTTITGTPLHILDFSLSDVLVWAGDDTGAWSSNTGLDWDTNDDGIGDATFLNGNDVLFADGAATLAIEIGRRVAPGSVKFYNAVDAYSFIGGGISGVGELSLLGGGAVTLANGVNNYAGATNIENGTLTLIGSATIADTPNIVVASAGVLDVSAVDGGVYPLDNQVLTIDGRVNGSLVAAGGTTVHANAGSTLAGDLTLQSAALVDGTGHITGNLVAQDGTLRVGGVGLSFTPSSFVIDDCESYALGEVRSVASPPWTAHSNTANAVIEDDGTGNQALAFGATSYVGVSRDLPAEGQIDDTETATFFFRLNSKTDAPDSCFGLADEVDTSSASYVNYETQVRIVDDASATGTYLLDARNGGSFSATLASGLATDTWYNIWMVVDQTTDTYDVYLNTGTADAGPADKLNSTPLHFRNGTTLPLTKVLGLGITPFANAVRYDDLTYFMGVDLRNPLGGLTVDPVGDSATLTVDGDVSLAAAATLELDVVADTLLDRLDVGGQLQAGGTLAVTFDAEAPQPQVGDAFDLFDADTCVGSFNVVISPVLAAGELWDLRALYTSGTITIVAADALIGDFADCLTGPEVTPASGCETEDQDGDGDVDLADYALLQLGFTE